MTIPKGTVAKAALLLGLLATFAAPVDARRGGSFGSRGSRTYSAPTSTGLSPGYTPGVSRSMTPRPAYGGSSYAPRPAPYAPSAYQYGGRSRFGGFGGGLLAGVLAGGLVGGLLGHGFGGGYGGYDGGGGGGFLIILIQLALLGGAVWLALRLFRGNRMATVPTRPFEEPAYRDMPSGYASTSVPASAPIGDDIALDASDQDIFERLLIELQDAFGREDYGRLRAITTPEIMSYLAEELGDNATHGRRNDVSATRLLDGEVSEAWQEDGVDYATIAMRYESVDVTRDRVTGAVTAGDERRPSETTELWTFVRPAGTRDWKVSAIQES